MHIAVCDDNGADRKQLERLLGRESDAGLNEYGPLYVESFGNPDRLYSNPMLYDIFFIDLCRTEGVSALEVVTRLLEKGVSAAIVLMCSEVDYRSQAFPEGVYFLDKAIKTAELHECIQTIRTQKNEIPNAIELREDSRTHYLAEADILYAKADGENHFLVTLADGTVIRSNGSLIGFFSSIEKEHETFAMPNRNAVLNARHIKAFKLGFHIVMTDGSVFASSRSPRAYLKLVFHSLHQ